MIDATRERAAPGERVRRRGRRRITAGTLIGWLVPIALLALLLAGWEIGVRLNDTPRWFLPTPSDIARELIESRSLLLDHTWTTLQEVLLGYAIAFAVGVASALVIGSSRVAERTVYPVIVATQAIPIIALAPILLIWFGFGMTPKVIVVVLLCYFPIAVNMADGLRSADRDAINLVRSMGASRLQVLRLVQVPSSLPYLISGARVAAAFAVIGAIVGEWVGASSGLGYLMTRAASQFLTARLFAAIGISAVIGIGMFLLVTVAGRILVPWQPTDEFERD